MMAGLRAQAWATAAILAGTIALNVAFGLDALLALVAMCAIVVGVWEILGRRQERKEGMH